MFYKIVRFFCRILIKIIFKVNVTGITSFPKEGAVIVYSNHKSNWDPIMIACVLDRPVFFMAKHELFEIPILRLIMKKVNAFPVNREKVDRKAIRTALKILKEQKVLGIFPEGTRNKHGKLKDPQQGIALIAAKSKDSALVPVAIKGEYKLFSDINLVFGKPKKLVSSNEKITSKKRKQISKEIFNEVVKLMSS